MVLVASFSIVMLFAGLSSAYLVSSADNFWVIFDLPPAFTLSTVLILISSATFYLAVRAIKTGKQGLFKLMVFATMVLGAGFAYTQFQGYGELVAGGHHLVGKSINEVKGEYGVDFTIEKSGVQLDFVEGNYYLPTDVLRNDPLNDRIEAAQNTASSYVYIITFVHLLHLIAGVIALLVINIKAVRNKYAKENYLGVTLGSMYWHFLGGLWVYLFLFFYLVH